MTIKNIAAPVAIALACLAGASPARAAKAVIYHLTDLGAASSASTARGINVGGVSVGTFGPHATTFSAAGKRTDLGTLGGTTSLGYALNTSGTAVGASTLSATNSNHHAFVWARKKMTDLGTLSTRTNSNSYAFGVNDAGQVVGWTDTDSNGPHAFLYASGAMTDLGTLPTLVTSAGNGINAAGHVVGVSTNVINHVVRAFFYANGQMTDIGAFGGSASYSVANAINVHDQVVGSSSTSSTVPPPTQSAFLYDQATGKMTDLGVARPGTDVWSTANAINDKGTVVGVSSDGQLNEVAFVYDGKSMADLNTRLDSSGAGWVLTTAYGIDNKGAIVGSGTVNGLQHAFLAVPVKP